MASEFMVGVGIERIEVRIAEVDKGPAINGKAVARLSSTVTIQAGGFLGSFRAFLSTTDLEKLHCQLRSALRTMDGTILFRDYEGELELLIKLHRDGNVLLRGIARPKRLPHGILHFSINSDHFELLRTLRELEAVLG
jgi:hypothetical protein